MSHKLLDLTALSVKLGGRSRSSLLTDIKAGLLPQPVRLGGRTYWRDDEIDEVIESLPRGHQQDDANAN